MEMLWICLSTIGAAKFFLILLHWNTSSEIKDISAIGVSITVLQTFLAVGALGGFFLLRSAAKSAAEEEARAEFAKFRIEGQVELEKVKAEIRESAQLIARRASLDYLDSTGIRYGTGNSAASTPDMMSALDDEEGSDDR
ncbi:hypothetical protein QWZ10_03010 [Paracoccus cavernae]|uniref:Uncharacterized protein n=1 Tax=Paracoccus cavernae TaxID=1571207 RepID=A0ABT8D3I2_9RHOB|nr:hypothetical protein [Paracoccus cavernae]